VSAWAVAAWLATLALILTGIALIRGSIETRLVALPLAASVAALDLLAIAQSFGNESAFDVAALAALLSYPAGLVFARFYARWL
jgi:multisubunit Na+/H+ antiporter MnhF subunit